MRRHAFVLLVVLATTARAGAQTAVPTYYTPDPKFSESLKSIVSQARLDSSFDVGEDGKETISLAVIDLTGKKPVFGGVHYDNFIYPASVYKMYVAMEILRQASEGRFSLFDSRVVQSPNDVDRSKEITFDPRPLLRNADTVSIHYLLDLMITRSDNSAANCLIDIAGRPNINKTMLENDWAGSEVTRKFLKRAVEDPGYDTIRSTETCALHAADFMYRIYTEKLVNPWVSMRMQSYLAMQLDTTKLSPGLPGNVMFSHKTGWWSYYTHDVGIVEDGTISYIIALFTPVPEERARPRMAEVARRVHELIVRRHPRSSKN
ncbi:MAG: class A beta-lactamase-related serine hydrolase [Bacteroidota bacterium]|nr:class A beta-lactamase-related serine hydrolase [Bacteroidota bacterium]